MDQAQPVHKILLVEDEKDVRELYQRQLTKAGFAVTAIPDGEKALETLKHNQFDLVLLDIMLPGINGLQVLKEFKTQNPQSPMKVMIVSNLGQDPVVKEGLSLGAVAYLVKVAYTPDQIVDEVRKTLGRST